MGVKTFYANLVEVVPGSTVMLVMKITLMVMVRKGKNWGEGREGTEMVHTRTS